MPVLKFLVDRQQGWLAYSLRAVTLTLSVAIPMAIILGSLFPNVKTTAINPADDWLLVVFLGPVIETFLLAAILQSLKLVSQDLMTRCLISAIIWAVIHGISFPIQGVVNLFNFWVFSIVFLVWQHKSFWTGFNMAMLVHVLHNAGVFAIATTIEYVYW